MKWHIVEHVALRIARVLIVALLGAMLDAGLFDGHVGERLAEPLVLSFKSSAAPAASQPLRSPWE